MMDQAERAAKALEKRKRQEQFEWTDDQFETWWNDDDRCRRDELIEEARFILEVAAADQRPVGYANEEHLAEIADSTALLRPRRSEWFSVPLFRGPIEPPTYKPADCELGRDWTKPQNYGGPPK